MYGPYGSRDESARLCSTTKVMPTSEPIRELTINEKMTAGQIAEIALGHQDSQQAILVFVRKLDDLGKIAEKLKNYPEMDVLLAELRGTRHLGSSVLYKAVRNDGVYEGGAVFNTSVSCSDEPAYLKALDDLKAIFDANGFKDTKINLYREISGRTTSTHLVVISVPSQLRVAELLDALSDKELLKDWYVTAAKIRTSHANGTYHEITK